jgi:KDO2-lipid IV(A) lauroyltransferase
VADRTPSLSNYLQYLGARAMASLLHGNTVPQTMATVTAIARLYYRVGKSHRQRACHHIIACYPDWPRERVGHVAEESFVHMFKLFLADAVVMPRLITPQAWQLHSFIPHLGSSMDLVVRKQPNIMVTGHFGNWEVLGYTMSVAGYPMHAVARPLDNPFINRWILDIRERHGMNVITKWGAAPILQKALANNGCVGFIADQNAGVDGMFVPFFGRLASSYKSIGLLAMRYKVPILVGCSIRKGPNFEFELTMTDRIDPEEWADQPDPVFYITARYNRGIEQMISMAPEQYLWVHRRWKSRPPHEREGKPFPGRLRGKLEELPWMTQSELDVIIRRSEEESGAHARTISTQERTPQTRPA